MTLLMRLMLWIVKVAKFNIQGIIIATTIFYVNIKWSNISLKERIKLVYHYIKKSGISRWTSLLSLISAISLTLYCSVSPSTNNYQIKVECYSQFVFLEITFERNLPLRDATWHAPIFLHFYSLVFTPCILHLQSTLPCSKRYPAWMHYWETVGEQLLILGSDKESRAVWNLKKETGESHGAYRPGRSPAAKEGPDNLQNALGFSSIYWHLQHWEPAVVEHIRRKYKVCLRQRELQTYIN